MLQLNGLTQQQTLEIVPEKTILLCYRGSIAHGTKLPSDDPNFIDDDDIIGVCVGSDNDYFGLGKFEQKEVKQGKWDSVVYEIRKVFRLLLQNNPNILSMLWCKEKDYIHLSDSGKLILSNRNLFVSKQVYNSFIGYSKSQHHHMTNFGDFKAGYMGAKRYELVKKYGFDVKNAQHTIRILRQGIEFLTTGELEVFRKDRQELMDIKKGLWSLDKVNTEIDRLFKLAEEAFVRSTLPAFPDKVKAEQLLIDILKKELV